MYNDPDLPPIKYNPTPVWISILNYPGPAGWITEPNECDWNSDPDFSGW